MEPVDVIIVGAGISGLVAARELQKSGLQVIVVEKGRGVGGRMATRRLGEAVFDHGAQFFTVRDIRFKALVDAMAADGVARCWFGEDEAGTHGRFRGVPAMAGPARWLARGLDVRGSAQAALVRVGQDSNLEVELEGGVVLLAQHVVLTAPLPQSLTLCKAGCLPLEPDLAARLDAVRYESCFALMAVLAGYSNLPEPGFVEPGGGSVISWMADNRMKGVSPSATALTIHASHAFTRQHFDQLPDHVTKLLLGAAAEWIRGEILETSLHRWRFAQPVTCLARLYAASDALPVVFAGDAFGGPKVEGAALSGWAAAERVLWSLSLR